MHNGDDTAYYLSLGFRVVAIDASPKLVEDAQKKFSNFIADRKLEILNVGIAATDAYMDFYLNKLDSVWNSFDKNIGMREGAEYDVIKVKTTSVDKIVKEKGVPYYMKIDIEGNDILCLTALLNCEEKPKYISVEMNEIDEILKLKELGYKKFKIIHQPSLLPLEIPELREYNLYKKHNTFKQSMNIFVRVARKLFGKTINKSFENKYRYLFEYNHPYGSSGPFAEKLPGKWLDFESVVKTYEYYKTEHERSGNDTGYNYWIDIHATN